MSLTLRPLVAPPRLKALLSREVLNDLDAEKLQRPVRPAKSAEQPVQKAEMDDKGGKMGSTRSRSQDYRNVLPGRAGIQR